MIQSAHTKAFAAVFTLLYFFTSCRSINPDRLTAFPDKAQQSQKGKNAFSELSAPKKKPLNLSFAGDIMAHNVNFRMKNYALIYEDIAPLLKENDVCFANLETPVCETREYQSYPCFNVHAEYVQAAIDAGFNVFSLANNHTNDQGKEGIEGSSAFFAHVRGQKVYSAGLKQPGSAELSYEVIECQGWKILFAAVTQLVNQNAYTSLFDFYPDTKEGTARLIEQIRLLKEKQPCDLFVLSVHTNDSEYVLEISEKRKKQLHELLDAGADIVWANHAHVSKSWESVYDTNGKKTKLIMYGLGNTISGQNPVYNFENPEHPYEYTGTGFIINVTVNSDTSDKQGIIVSAINPVIIATHIDGNYNFIIKRLTADFIASQNAKLSRYYTARLDLMKKIQDIGECKK